VSVAQPTIQAGLTTKIILQARDAKGINEQSGGLNVVFKLLSSKGGLGTFGTVTDNDDGTYSVMFSGTIAGSNAIRAYINGVASATAAIKVTPGPYSLTKTAVSVSSATVKSSTAVAVTLTLEDAYGNKPIESGLKVEFALGNGAGQGTFSAVKFNKNGTYTATFTGSTVGTNTIDATIDGQTVAQAPSIAVIPGAASTATSYVTVASPQTVEAGTSIAVTFQTVDASGNKETSGGLKVAFELGNRAGRGTFSSVKDNRNGTYTTTFTGTIAGSITIVATINGHKVATATPTITVTPGSVSLAKSVVTDSPGSVASGSPIALVLQPRDAWGNDVDLSGQQVVFSLGSARGGQGTISAATYNAVNGTYTTTFTGTIAGTNTIKATYNNSAIASAAPAIVVTPGS
jgi:hypothetical protein